MSREKVNKIYDAVKKVNRAYEAYAANCGLTLYEMEIYYVMLENGCADITQKDLCRQLEAPKTSINSIIKKQLKENRIEMKVNPLNKREKIISLTKTGKIFAENLIFPLFKWEEDIISGIADDKFNTAVFVQTEFADGLLQKIKADNCKK